MDCSKKEIIAPLEKLTGDVADWADTLPEVSTVYIFGSRVRGDHRQDSDVDLHIEIILGVPFPRWGEENRNNFANLRRVLPGELSLHQDANDVALPYIKKGEHKYRCRKVICVVTPKKSEI